MPTYISVPYKIHYHIRIITIYNSLTFPIHYSTQFITYMYHAHKHIYYSIFMHMHSNMMLCEHTGFTHSFNDIPCSMINIIDNFSFIIIFMYEIYNLSEDFHSPSSVKSSSTQYHIATLYTHSSHLHECNDSRIMWTGVRIVEISPEHPQNKKRS